MKVAITGSSGLIGSELVRSYAADGHKVLRLVRRTPTAPDEAQWDPTAGSVDMSALKGVDAVVNLAGAGVGDKRWTESYKRVIRDSRVLGTQTIAEAVAALDPAPRVLVSGGAIGYYGDTGDSVATEETPAGEGFLADVVVDWEAAAEPARAAGIRVVHPRNGLVVAAKGGAWGPLFRVFRLGIGGNLGNGRQYWSFISLEDEVRALRHVVDSDLRGPVNLTAPNPVRQSEVADVMGKVLHRPSIMPGPAFGMRLVLGEFANEILMSQRVVPARLEADGFVFQHPTIEAAVRAALRD